MKKKVFLIPMSLNEKTNEDVINEAIFKIGKDKSVSWLTDLIKPLDSDKFMLMADVDEESEEGTDTPEIGVKVIRGSQSYHETEELINTTLLEMETDEEEPKTLISLSSPSENMYIILFEYKAGNNPRVKIVPNPADPHIGSRKLSKFFNVLDKDEEWGLQPYDSFMLNKDYMMILFQ